MRGQHFTGIICRKNASLSRALRARLFKLLFQYVAYTFLDGVTGMM